MLETVFGGLLTMLGSICCMVWGIFVFCDCWDCIIWAIDDGEVTLNVYVHVRSLESIGLL